VFTVWRHYTARFLRAAVAAFAILALLLISVDAMLHLASLFEQARTPAEAVQLLLERAGSTYAEYLLPIAAFVAAFWCAGTATLQREVIALKAGGISPLAAFAPLLGLALVLSALQSTAIETLGVRAAAARIARKSPSSGDAQVHASGTWYHAGRVLYSARDVDATTGVVHEIRVYERDRAGQLVRTIAAARAERVAPQRWRFEDALVREFDPDARFAPPRERREAIAWIDLPSDRSPRLRRDELAGLPLATLRRYVASRIAAGANPGQARVVLHNRLSAPAAVLVFALLGVPLALHSEGRRSLARAALQGAGLVVVLLTARETGSNFAALSPELAAAFPWLTLGLLALLGLGSLARVQT
jgi:lipopolysaccharide export LptBFGC system permease protein LptF